MPNTARHSLLRFFAHDHLPPELGAVSVHFADLAVWIDENVPAGPEQTVALRKLLEAKDCAVRAMLPDAAPKITH